MQTKRIASSICKIFNNFYKDFKLLKKTDPLIYIILNIYYLKSYILFNYLFPNNNQ